jgi:DnaA family protein
MPARAATPAVTEQLVFDLASPEPPTFGNFLPGANAEALAVVKALATGGEGETGVMLWGAPGAGKTHLLRALVAAVAARGRPASFLTTGELAGLDMDILAGQDVVAIDDIDRATPDSQGSLFTLFNGLRERGHHLVVASRIPLATLSLREDLRTRLGWGLVYEVTPLADADKPAALAAYAKGRGFALPDDVVQYLLAHGRRDMAALVNALAALDRYSLSTKRPITVPLLRGWFQRDIDLGDPGP